MFQGRTAALVAITNWINSHDHPGQVLVVSGQPGGGKSAVISRAGLTTSRLKQGDRSWHGLLFHARQTTVQEFQSCVADLTGANEYSSASALISEIDSIGEANPQQRWVIMVDALDEALSRSDRAGMAGLLAELARRPWIRAAVATRPLSAAGPYSPGSILRNFGVTNEHARNLIDLDSDTYYEPADLIDFSRMLLSQDNVPYPAPPIGAWRHYRSDYQLSMRLAAAVATRAQRNFLAAALTAVQLSEQESVHDPAIPGFNQASLPASLGDALDRYLDSRPDSHRFRGILTALAYAEGAGMDDGTWILSSQALGYPVTQAELDGLRTGIIADYLLETITDHEGSLIRLFHQALNDQLLEQRNRQHDQEILVAAYLRDINQRGGWASAKPYMLRHLADHAAHARKLGELVADSVFLLHADLATLNSRVGRLPPSERPPQAWVTLRAGVAAYGLPPHGRAMLLAVVAAHMGLSTVCRELAAEANGLLDPVWAHTLGSAHTLLTGHEGGVQAIAAVPMPNGHTLIASASTDHTVRLWDPDTGQPMGQPLIGHEGRVQAIAAVPMPNGRTLIASASTDHTVRLWDSETRQQVGRVLTGHTDWVQAVVAIAMPEGRTSLASASDDGTVRLWDSSTGAVIRQMLTGSASPVWALAAVPMHDGRTLLASGGKDSAIRLWDTANGLPVGEPMMGHSAPVLALTVVPMADGRILLASGSQDGSLRLWDPETGRETASLISDDPRPMWAVTSVPLPEGKMLLASGGDDGIVRLWDPELGSVVPNGELTGHSGPVEAAVAVPIPGSRTMLATGGADGSVHLCDADVGLSVGELIAGHADWVWAMAAVPMSDGHTLLASGSTDTTVRLWDPETGHPVGHPFLGHHGPVWGIAAIRMPEGGTILASAGYGDSILLWDLDTGAPLEPLDFHVGMPVALSRISGVEALCSLINIGATYDQPALLASAGADGTVRLWDLRTGLPFGRPLMGHAGMARALTSVPMPDGRLVLASAGQDATVRLWDPANGSAIGEPLTGHSGPVSALTTVLTPDGRTLLASASIDATVRVWDPVTGYPLGGPMTGHTGRIRAIAAIPLTNGQTVLASSGTDATVRLWDPVTVRPIGIPAIVAESVTSMVVINNDLAIASEHAICMLRPRPQRILSLNYKKDGAQYAPSPKLKI
jgi:WD40 repeat protein